MKKRYAVAAAIAALAVVLLTTLALSIATLAKVDSQTEVCPDGQELVSVQAGSTVLHNDKALPPGAHFEDRFGKITVRSDGDSATANVPLAIRCK